jgi:hypothetical protein
MANRHSQPSRNNHRRAPVHRIDDGVSPRLAPAADILPEPAPIWLAALIASRCAAKVEGGIHSVEWNHVRGRAIYTNAGVEPEWIQPLGVRLAGGDTVAVSWLPGETAYTVEIIRQRELCA